MANPRLWARTQQTPSFVASKTWVVLKPFLHNGQQQAVGATFNTSGVKLYTLVKYVASGLVRFQ